MKLCFALLLAAALTPTCAQELRVMRNASPFKYEEYTILKKSKTRVREGQYLRLSPSRLDTVAIGQYTGDKRTGRWRFYENKLPIAAGRYADDARIGEWTYYENGKALLRYNHTDNIVVWQSTPDADSDVADGDDVTPTRLDRNAVCPGLHQLIVENIQYPVQAQRNNITGSAMVSVLVNADGSATDPRVEQGLAGGCDGEVLRVLKLNTTPWLPGQRQGKAVATRQYVVAEFSITPDGDTHIKTSVY